MNNWFTVKVKYTKQLDDGTFKKVSEPYLVAAMSFTDAETRIFEDLGEYVRGEFTVTSIARTDFHDIFKYDDAEIWYKCKIQFESEAGGTEDLGKGKKVTQNFLISAHSVKNAYERLGESLGGMMLDFAIPSISQSTIVDIFPFNDELKDAKPVKSIKQVSEEIEQENVIGRKSVFSASGSEEDEEDFEDDFSQEEE